MEKNYKIPHRFFVFSLVLLLGLVFAESLAYAKTRQVSLAEIGQKWPRYSERSRLTILEKLIKIGQFDFAQQLLGRTKFSQGSRLTAKFLQGALYKNKGEYAEAAKVYRGLLAQNPKLHRVRLELAHALFLMKEDQSAKHHFNLLMASGNAKSQQSLIQSFIDAMDRRKKWHLNSYLTVAPSTNMNQGTDNTSVTLNGLDFKIDENSKRKSGVGVNAGLSAGGRLSVTDNLDMVVSGAGHIKKYRDDKFDDLLISGSMGPRLRFNKGHVALYGTVSKRWFGHEAYSKNFGTRLNTGYRLSAKDVLSGNIIWERRRYDVADYQDGDFFQLDLKNDYYLNSHSFVRIMGTVSKEKTDRDYLNYKSWQAGLGFYKEFPLGLSLYSQAQYTVHNYDGLYPGGTEARKGQRLDLMLQLTKRDWNIFGYAPSILYNYARSDSNIAFHEFDSHSLNLTLSKDF